MNQTLSLNASCIAKDTCADEAGARVTLADAKMGRQSEEEMANAAADNNDADSMGASEKCDALAGEAKSVCVAAAKARFGKS